MPDSLKSLLLLTLTCLLLAACGKEAVPVETTEEQGVDPSSVASEAEAEAEAEPEQASGVVSEEQAVEPAEASVVEEPADDEPEPEEESGGNSLRDRITVTPADPNDRPIWSQAETIEERMANLTEALAGEPPYVIDMHDLGGWILDEREEQPIPDHILALDGKEFIMRGFMMPDIDFEHIRKFHLVRSLYSCCFGAPPQLNEIMRVTLADEDGMEYTYNTLEVRGTLHIEFEMVDGLVEDIFRLEGATYRILDFDDPEAPESFDASTGFEGVVPSKSLEY